jgi:AraC-like DNA-binding protein
VNIFRRLFNRFAPPSLAIPEEHDEYLRDAVVRIFRRDWSPKKTLDPFANEQVAISFPVLPRGSITAIAREAGCSQGYVSRLAKEAGYRVGKAA